MNMSNASQLLGSYLHQDWREEFESDQAALEALADSEPREQLAAAVVEIDALLDSISGEEDLRAFVQKELSCYFDPSSKDMSYAAWLRHVRNFLTEKL